MHKIFSVIVIFFSAPSIVYAHGEDILVSIYGGIFMFLVFVVFLFFFKASLRIKALLFVLFTAAYIIAWISTKNMPYTKNIVLINAIHWGFPAIVWLIGYLSIKRKWLNT